MQRAAHSVRFTGHCVSDVRCVNANMISPFKSLNAKREKCDACRSSSSLSSSSLVCD